MAHSTLYTFLLCFIPIQNFLGSWHYNIKIKTLEHLETAENLKK